MQATFVIAAAKGDFATDTALYDRSVVSTNFILDFWWIWVLAAICFVFYVSWQRSNALVRKLDQRCRSAFGDIDAILEERHALIPNLVELTREHLDTNREILDKLLDAQQRALEAIAFDRMAAESIFGDAINSIVSVAGKVPDLKNSAVFEQLRSDLTRLEEKLTAARRYYNSTVEEFNAVRQTWPHSLFAGRTGDVHAFFSVGERREELARPINVSLG